jgi:hypothetical protein
MQGSKMSDHMPQGQSPFTIKQTSAAWTQARQWAAAAIITLLFFLAILIIWQVHASNKRANAAISFTPTPSPTATVTPTPTATHDMVSVTYLVAVESDEWPHVTVDLWYSSGPEQRNQERGRRILASNPYIIEAQLPPGTFVELFAAMQSSRAGNLTCRLIVADTVIQERSSRGQGAGVYCSGPAIP